MLQNRMKLLRDQINAMHASVEKEDNLIILRAIFKKYNYMLCLDNVENAFQDLGFINREQRLHAKALQTLPNSESKMLIVEFSIRDINYENN